jgi:hypothetical protein
METLNYNELYEIVKYQYDKVKKERDSKMTEEEKKRRSQLDRLADFSNNPSLSSIRSLAGEYLSTSRQIEKDDPSSYVYYSKNYI